MDDHTNPMKPSPDAKVPGSAAITAGAAMTMIVFILLAGGLAAFIVGGLFSAQEEWGPDEMPPALEDPTEGIPPESYPTADPTVEGPIPEAATPGVPEEEEEEEEPER